MQVRALVCRIFSFDMGELPKRKVSKVCLQRVYVQQCRENICSHTILWEEGRILEHSRALPLPVLFYFLSFFLDEIPAKSLLCGGESVGMLCAYSLDFKTLMHKEGLTVRASGGVQPTAFLANLFYVQCSELPHFKL